MVISWEALLQRTCIDYLPCRRVGQLLARYPKRQAWKHEEIVSAYGNIRIHDGSDTTDRMLARFDRDVLSNNPQYCIIQGGTNDLYWDLQPPLYGDIQLNPFNCLKTLRAYYTTT